MEPNGERSERSSGRGSGWEPLALGVTGIFLGLVAVGASALNSRTNVEHTLTGPVWQVLTLIAALAGAAAVVSWALSGRRLGPGPMIGAVIGLVAAVGSPVEALAVRPHPSRVRVLAVDGRTGKVLWSVRPPLTDVSSGFFIGPDGSLVARGGDVTARCSSRSVEVHLKLSTGRTIGRPAQVAIGALLPSSTAVDGDARYEIAQSPGGNVLIATVSGVRRWSANLAFGPLPLLSAGSGVVVVGDVRGGIRTAVAAPPGGLVTEGGLRVLDASTGNELWSDSNSGLIGAAIAGGAVWTLGSDGTLSSRDTRTGSIASSAQVRFQPLAAFTGAGGGLWSVGDTLVALSAGDELEGVDTHGATRWHVSVPGLASGPETVVTTAREAFVGVGGRVASTCGGE